MRRVPNPLSGRPPSRRRGPVLLAAFAALLLAACAGAQVKPPQSGPLVPPAGVTTFGDQGVLTIGWQEQERANTYNLYWSTSPNPTPATATKIAGLVASPYVHNGLTPDQEVYYLITAVNASGESSPTAFRATPLKVGMLKFEQHLAVIVQPTETFDSLAARFLNDRRKGGIIQDYNELEKLTPYQAVTIPLRPWKLGGLTATEYQLVPVLTYHRFSTDGTANRMTVPAANFEAQMKFLNDNDYRVVTLDQFDDFLEFKAQLPDRAVVITADDGWMSFYQIAYPILKKYGYPATLFVYSDFPESDPLALTWVQVKEMAKGGIDIECHSKTHRNLRMESGEDFRAYLAQLELELKGVQEEMKRKGGITCRYLAYPYGGRNPLVVALTQKYGFRAAFTVTRGSNSFFAQDFIVRRSMIYGEYGLKEFQRNLNVSAELK
jgi:peptidoglycan/xylan/chitin deacetylase (PgdA/CDA1 family)